MKVPLNYGPREKYLARLDGNPDLDREIAITLPRMSFELTNLYYDSSRKMQTLNRITTADPSNPDAKIYQYAPVPYNIEFQLSIMVKNAEDGTFIIEQILPFFTPEWTATLNLNPDMGLKYDVPVTLDNITSEDTYEGDFVQRRAIIWTLNFSMKGWLFGPTKSGGKVIKDMDINLIIPPMGVDTTSANTNNTDPTVNIGITPGQYSNGQAVSWYGDAQANTRPVVVAANTVVSNTSYGFMIDFTENY